MSTGNFLRRLFGNGADPVDRRVQDLLSLCQALLAESGEYASLAIARDTLAAYHALDEKARLAAFPNARLKGEANLLVMPTLDAAHIAFNLLKTAAGGGIVPVGMRISSRSSSTPRSPSP